MIPFEGDPSAYQDFRFDGRTYSARAAWLRYETLNEVVDLAVANDMGERPKLVLVGRIAYAVERGEITLDEASELRDRLGVPDDIGEVMAYAASGEPA